MYILYTCVMNMIISSMCISLSLSVYIYIYI